MRTLERGVHVVSLYVAHKVAKVLDMLLSGLIRHSEQEPPLVNILAIVRTGSPSKKSPRAWPHKPKVRKK